MDIQVRPQTESAAISPPSLPRSTFYTIVQWVARNRRWLPIWAKLLFLKMVRRKIGAENMRRLCNTASKQLTKEQIERRDQILREEGLL